MKHWWIVAVLAACSSGGGDGGSDSPGTAQPLEATWLEFGQSDLGRAVQQTLLIRNPFEGLPVSVTRVESTSSQIALVDPVLPVVLQPGERLPVTVTWTPTIEGFFSSVIRVESDERAPLVVGVSGTGFTSEQITSFGAVPLEPDGKTRRLSVLVPSNAISLTIEAWGGTVAAPTGGAITLDELTGPSNRVYVDPAQPFAGPYFFDRNFPGLPGGQPANHATFMVPNSDADAAQLLPNGTYEFVLSNEAGSLTELNVKVIVERRMSPDDGSVGHIDLNVFLARSLTASAGNATSSPHLQSLLARADNVLGSIGLGFGNVDYYKLTDPQFDHGNPFDPSALFRQSAMARERRLNVFVVLTSSNGVAGLSGAIPHPRATGSPYAGIFVLGDENIHPDDLGTILAHEIGHALGLGHTQEPPGMAWQYDRIEDTCPGTNCVGDVSMYLMEPGALPPGTPLLTPGQALVMRRHVLVDPGRATFTPGALLGVSPLLAASRLTNVRCPTCP
ncbi:MAG: hypothetical protein ACYS0F_07055 [Planctomycetota bacterium]|jgi:hypothetical protein